MQMKVSNARLMLFHWYLSLQITFYTIKNLNQCTVVGGVDKTPMVIQTDRDKFEFFGSFWVYFKQKSVFKHFKSMNNPLKSA